MTKREKYEACESYFNELAWTLKNYVIVPSNSKRSCSVYLVPDGTESEITYYSKPGMSFRFSDHWNWYANLNKCSDELYVQCNSIDMPRPKSRKEAGSDSIPVFGVSVMFADLSGVYHCIFGEKYDRKKKSWAWIETPIESVMKRIGYKEV